MKTLHSRLVVSTLRSLEGIAPSLWISCHGYESRSIAHLEKVDVRATKMLSYGFTFPEGESSTETGRRILDARERLREGGFYVIIADDDEFEVDVIREIKDIQDDSRCRIVADISSMSRSRIASLILACASKEFSHGCDLDLIYFPSFFPSHKHEYEPLEFFGPCHGNVAGWPSDADLPLSLVMGLGTEPSRADGVVESLEPDILALFVPQGDDDRYLDDIRNENKRVLSVVGQPIIYPLRDPESTYITLVAATSRLAERSRVVIVPLGPKVFFAVSVAAALSVGPEIGVWKASAGHGVAAVDVQAIGHPILMRLQFVPIAS